MNTNRLHLLFQSYIDHFEFLNNKEHNESFKWAVVQMFQDKFKLDTPDFHAMLKEVCSKTSVLIDGGTLHPFHALVVYAENEPETVRQMFADLYADDGGDLAVRQKKITAFIEKSEELREKYYSLNAFPYKNDQRSVMAYLFMKDPDHNYLFKATEAREFADCVEFYDDFGTTAQLKLPVFYRMCGELVAAIREYPPLMETHLSRFEMTGRSFHPDTELHILAFDIIYTSQAYHIYDGIEYEKPNAKEKKLYLEKVEKAKELQETYNAAMKDAAALEDLRSTLYEHLKPGKHVCHKSLGDGAVDKLVFSGGQSFVSIVFSDGTIKKFGLFTCLAGKLLTFDDGELTKTIDENMEIIKRESSIKSALKYAENALQPYLEYLE